MITATFRCVEGLIDWAGGMPKVEGVLAPKAGGRQSRQAMIGGRGACAKVLTPLVFAACNIQYGG